MLYTSAFFGRIYFDSFLPSPVVGQSNYGKYGGEILVNIYDTKTLLVDLPEFPPIIGGKITVKINGFVTPQLKGNCGKESRLAVKAKKYRRCFKGC
jgi:micrococcal nuclease